MVLSLLLFIIVLQDKTEEIKTGCPWEMLYIDDAVLIGESILQLEKRFLVLQQGLETRVNLAELLARPRFLENRKIGKVGKQKNY